MKKNGKEILLKIENLKKHFPVKLGAFGEKSGVVYAVDGISFDIYKGETLGMVGESGCGKSTAGFTILQLYEPTAGKVFYNDVDLTSLDKKELRGIRKKVQMIFQDPYSTLNPRMTIGEAIGEPLNVHFTMEKKAAKEKVQQLLKDVGLNPNFYNRYPHEFSGGQRQRICIARALAVDPEFIVCDEPISALDVSIQAQIINLMQELQVKYDLTYLFIAHDLAVVRHISDRVVVMYLGQVMELSPTKELFSNPQHPYTKALLSAVPEPNPKKERERRRIVLEGDVPSALTPPSGCRFHTRCVFCKDECSTDPPKMREVNEGHYVACHTECFD